MEVRIDQDKYQATSQMPQIVSLDSIAVEKPKFGDKENGILKSSIRIRQIKSISIDLSFF
ncbi:hypothetical protein KUH03_03490 [Sphingobacterium sp. E70]|uniref:hypothetical protein n=1 Tax=Sphingobacterium sp. E70 TaxID=2853439 RepID=UPI00211CDD87|nr:hypothetical protein [Sphingobacterium sp. E70]ULT26047.1 hypothetical protein KUH03_03490 [Sphingobacterium sp. E70]